MKKSLFRFLCLTVAMPLLLAACTAAPTGDASSALASSKAGGASVTETSADASLTGDASETATSPADASEETSSGAAISALSSLTSSKASSATSSKTSSATSSKTSSATSSRTSSTAASSQAVSSVYTPPADTRVINSITYQLTFKDEFEGTSLNSTYWYCCPEGPRQDVGGRWADSMVSVHDGCLYLGAAVNSNGTPISGAVRTMNKWYQVKWSQCKGYFECRAKLQSAPGFWGAFWLMSNQNMGNNNNTNGAKDGAEIDIMESFSVAQGGVNHAIHWDGYGDNHKSTGKSVYNKSLYDGQFHTFGMAWTDSQYIFYIDGKETYRVGNSTVANVVCEVPLYLKLTVEFGSWAGTINKTKLPDAFVVDYVRVYKAV